MENIAKNRLLQLMTDEKLNNQDIADDCGVTRQAVWNVVHYKTKNVPVEWIIKLTKKYGVNANEFFSKDAKPTAVTDPRNNEFVSIPILGNIAASFGRNSEELTGDHVLIPPFMLKNRKQCFGLKVSGDSMVGAGILDGDICIIEKQPDTNRLKNGDIAAFRIDGDTTLKTFEKNKDQIWLVPANPKYQPISLSTKNDVELIGTFVSLLRPPV